MKITVSCVTPETVCINGQELARSYAESILLPLMVAAQGQNHAAIIKVAEAFDTAGLALEAAPEASRIYRSHKIEKQAERDRLLAEARANSERCREPSRQEIAEQIAKRERQAQEIRDHGARLRAARGR